MLGGVLAAVVPAIALCLLTRPLAEHWPATVTALRQKEPGAAGSFEVAMKPVHAAYKDKPNRWPRLRAMAWARCTIGIHTADDDARVWSADALLFSIGCTHKKCYVGAYGKWHSLPGAKYDLYALVGAHGAACLVSYVYGIGTFLRFFSPRFSAPYTIPLSLFATASPFELVWLSGSILGIGSGLQRSIGRGTFLLLYLGGALASSLLAASYRHSANGASGALAAHAFHAIAAPHARHSIFGMEMGAKAALAVQAGLSTYPMLSGGRAGTAIALNVLPMLLGAALCKVLQR